MYFENEAVAESFFNDADLGEIGHAYSTRPCVGTHEVESIEVIAGEALRAGLLAIGNDGAFFDQPD